MSKNTTWHVDITLTQLEGTVTAEARLASGSPGVTGVGHASAPPVSANLERAYVLAARRSLEALGGALEYVIDASHLSAADQA